MLKFTLVFLLLPFSAFADVTEQDRSDANNLPSLYASDPRLGPAVSSELEFKMDLDFDGLRSEDWIRKDEGDQRLFKHQFLRSLHNLGGPIFEENWRLVLNERGIDWALEHYPRASSLRHSQILEYYRGPEREKNVKILRELEDGALVLYFNGSLFVVAKGGMGEECEKRLVPACAEAWQRVNNSRDPFDAKER